MTTREQMDEYAKWHRKLCQLDDWLFVSGDLHPQPNRAFEQLEEWRQAGITDIMDLRLEWSDKDYVNEVAPDFTYHYLPTDDAGQRQQDRWFEEALEIARRVRGDGGKIVAHCHMGAQRAPSLALRLMLDVGWQPIAAMDRIRSQRPVAGIGYAHDAVRHWAKSNKEAAEEIQERMDEVSHWFKLNHIDLHTIIRAIRTADDYH